MIAPFFCLMLKILSRSAIFFTLVLLGFSLPAAAGEILDQIKSDGLLRCGVQAGQEGLAVKDDSGNWRGFEIDLCRSWSAALFGTPDQVSFVEVGPETGLKALNDGRIDVLALHEDALFGRRDVSFAGSAFVNSLGLMVRRADAFSNALELDGGSVCFSGDDEAKGRIEAFASQNRMTLNVRETGSIEEGVLQLREGSCTALMAGRLALAGVRSREENGAALYEILPDLLSKRLMGPVTLSGDRAWQNVVRWGVFAMLVAEEKQVSSESLASMASSTEDPAIRRLLGFEGDFGTQLGLDVLWAYRIVEAVGNYGEVYDRHFGPGRPTELERGPNALWIDGGLMRAPPFQ
ncbi:transporter substrate-binding domain-containing protein [Denitrobaculum tricleocarpae]|uniref:Transporter substrate-binding domain-containing protein n=1 Tax=Denitrobaculum tricleocarpae TaxID=2591009 RepID=A0A545TQ41_9PROT|nr:transporter substrate-binding domain-containing protein [Denitrobaculum tricleocarpae]TQV79346.1 transporter substrate-binding domain-containing protein [Denitrobaculum tricleocarpae]